MQGTAIIYKSQGKTTQSGKAKDHKWILSFNSKSVYADPLMGWTANSETQDQIKLTFNTKEAAQQYAIDQGWKYSVSPEREKTHIIKSYADNFKRP